MEVCTGRNKYLTEGMLRDSLSEFQILFNSATSTSKAQGISGSTQLLLAPQVRTHEPNTVPRRAAVNGLQCKLNRYPPPHHLPTVMWGGAHYLPRRLTATQLTSSTSRCGHQVSNFQSWSDIHHDLQYSFPTSYASRSPHLQWRYTSATAPRRKKPPGNSSRLTL